ncbi:MAG: response regulator [Chloroflexi bacterium]|nr:response regulator [Chloroflexota bacterium]
MDHEKLLYELRRALAHLDDPPYLESLEIAEHMRADATTHGFSKGQALRQALRLAIAALDPGGESGTDRLQGRTYEVLYRYAVGKQSVTAIGSQLSISSRQAYRELQRALEALAHMMGDIVGQGLGGDQPQRGTSQMVVRLREELDRLSNGGLEELDLCQLVLGCTRDIHPLATELDVDLSVDVMPAELLISGNRVMLRQLILNLLSHCLKARPTDTVTVRVRCSDRDAQLKITHRPGLPDPEANSTSPYAVARTLLDSLGLDWQRMPADDLGTDITISFPLAREYAVLIVDDNPDLIRLFRRYLGGQAYRVHAAHSFEGALDVLKQLRPDVVIIDVMMPKRDGWELLQRLRALDESPRLGIVVCSIINDPSLAAALGADAFLHKPVGRKELLETLAGVLSAEP